jgi:O-antigen ligase
VNLQLDPTILALIIGGAVLAHIALAVAARFVNIQFILVGAFIAVAPWSASLVPGAEGLKFGRLYLSVLSVAVAVLVQRQLRMSLAATLLLAFLTLYWLASLWSDNVMGGLQFKGMVMPAALMGILCISTIKTERDLVVAMRLWAAFALLFAAPAILNLFTKGITLTMGGRFAPFGISNNRMAHECASMLIICMPIALFDRSLHWKIFAYGVGTMCALCILASGSRAAVLQSVVPALLMGLPLIKRPILPIMLGSLSAAILWFAMPSGARSAYSRLERSEGWNRHEPWYAAMEEFLRSPFIGVGWAYTQDIRAGGSTVNFHSIYFQVLAELGVVGVVVFAVALAVVAWNYFALWRLARQHNIQTRWVFVGLGFTAAPLAHGIAESSTFMPGTINLLMLGMGFAMTGPLREMILNRQLADAAPPEDGQYDEADDEYAEYSDYGDYGQQPRTV